MYFPLVGERVWVSGCTHEFFVVRADYSACAATISPCEDPTQVKRCSFHLLFSHDDFKASQNRSAADLVEDVLGSSRLCTQSGRASIGDYQETIRSTRLVVEKTLALIVQTDRVIEGWKRLGCKA